MALAVASTAIATTISATTVVVTKPTGVQVGDLLVILASTHLDSGSPPTCSGFTSKISVGSGSGLNPKVVSAILWRIADASDVSASDYTVNGAIATMMRITGWTSGDPFFFTDSEGFEVTASPTSLGNSVTAQRPTSSIMLIVSGTGTRTTDRNPTWASYSVTSGESNPSWTEVQDAEFRYNGSDYGGQAVAYATTSNTSNVTAWAATMTGPVSTNRVTAIFAIICEPQNVTTDIAHQAITPTQFGVTASQVNVATDIAHQNIPVTQNGIATVAKQPTQWQNETKPSTNWNNDTL
jgi:hypothetical protein